MIQLVFENQNYYLKLYFEKLEKELKDQDRYMLKKLKYEMKIKEEIKDGLLSYLSKIND